MAMPALTPGHPSAKAVGRWLKYAAPLVRLAFRPRLDGVEHLPRDRTVVIAVIVLSTPISQLPWIPWTIRMRFGPAIEPDQLFTSGDDLTPAYERVRGAVEAQVLSAAGTAPERR